jgi:GT2 family glycosyltransferase
MRSLGYRIIYTPLAEMVHTEKASRGDRLPPGEDLALFQSRWKAWLDQDPAWHPNLRRDRLDMTPQPEAGAWYL